MIQILKIANDLRSYIDEDFQKKEIIKFNKKLNLNSKVNKFEDYRVDVFFSSIRIET